jgi:calcium-dependent protein kinase
MGCCVTKNKELRKETSRLAEYTFSIAITEVYEIQDFCGSGRYGIVSKASLKSDPSQFVAIKRISKEFIDNPQSLTEEVNILCQLHHPNIIKIYETYQDIHFFYIVMQYCSGGTLYSRMNKEKVFSEKEAVVIVKQMVRAVRYLHSKGICHRDIKPENFLFSSEKKDSRLKLIDFGLSQKLGKWFKGMNEIAGTVHYVAPEVIKGKYDEKCDNWSIGVIMYLLLSGSLPFYAKSDEVILHKIENNAVEYDPDIWEKISSEGNDLVKKLLCKKAEDRITMEEAYQHKWFQKEFDDSENLQLLNTIRGYAEKEEISVRISNHLLNTMNYMDLYEAAEMLGKLGEEHMTVVKLEENLGKTFELAEKRIQVNGMKIIRAAMSSKLHLNEEKIWQTFVKYGGAKAKRIPFSDVVTFMKEIEGKKTIDQSKLAKTTSYTFEDLMKHYDQGRQLNDL